MSELQKVFCTNCGAQIEVDLDEIELNTVYCFECGNEIDISELIALQKESENADNASQTKEESSPFQTFEEDNKEERAAENAIPAPTPEKTAKTNSDQRVSDPYNKPSSQPVSQNPFTSISDEEKKEIENKISSRVKVWHDAIVTTSAGSSEFTDNFAHGMPDWDLTPPDMLIRRKAAKPAENRR